VGSVTGATEDN